MRRGAEQGLGYGRSPRDLSLVERMRRGAGLTVGCTIAHRGMQGCTPLTDKDGWLPDWHSGQERAPASHQLDAGDSALDEFELADAVVDVGLIFHDVCVGVVGEQLSAKGLWFGNVT